MTDPIRDAAKALCDAFDNGCVLNGDVAALPPALSASQPAADERVAEHMRRVEASTTARNLARYALDDFIAGKPAGGLEAVNARCAEAAEALSAAQASARALLAAGREEARQALAFRMLVRHWNEFGPEHGFGELIDRLETSATQKGTP